MSDGSPGTTGERLEAVVRGMVQGVGFRWFVVRAADRFGLTGWVANDADGSLRVVAEGPAPGIGRLLELLQEGPSGALVERVDEERSAPTGEFARFEIRARAHRGD